jgi:beta-lactamase regulating signal transducer with metallopeptidase domain
VAQLGCVVYWFNPLAWIAARQLRREQELACDQAVLDLGARPSTYAHHLLNIARGATRRRALPALALDMARRSQMEGRLMSILAARPARSRRAAVLPALFVLVALPVLAAVQPKAAAPPAPTPPAPASLHLGHRLHHRARPGG